jgi:hypothetical protein
MLDFMRKKGKGKEQDGVKTSAAAGRESEVVSGSQEVKRKILMVGKGPGFSAGAVDYAANLAQRLGYDLIGVSLNSSLELAGKFFSPYRQHLRARFAQRARGAWELIEPELRRRGIRSEHLVKFDDVPRAVKELNHEIKRIDFVITDVGITDEEITGEIPLPVFSITGYQGEKVMAQEHDASRSKLIGKTAALGLGSVALYAAVFLNSETVMQFFTKGGLYAALPIATVFLVSFVHGAFASSFWSMLGIEATKKAQPRVAAKRPAQRKRPRPQLRVDV